MSELILVTGGARSGKSTFAEDLAKEKGGEDVLYIATAAICDEEMRERVKKHRQARPKGWSTLEQDRNFYNLNSQEAFRKAQVILVDCIGFMLNNIMFHHVKDVEECTIEEMEQSETKILCELSTLLHAACDWDKTMILVTNEIGLGLVPMDRFSRYYRDILGRANQLLASQCEGVYFLVSGIPMKIK